MNKGKEILKQQNTETNIDRLLAQRRLYSKAKTFKWSFVLITIILPIIISFLDNFRVIEIKEWQNIYIIYIVIAFIIGIIFDNCIDNYKNIAAAIQEEFDISIFSIPRREYFNTKDINFNLIRQYSRKSRNKPEIVKSVKDWYSTNIQKVKTNIAILLCQRANVLYDERVRIRYKNCLIYLIFFIFIILLLIFLKNEFLVEMFLYKVVIPLLPIGLFLYDERKEVNASISNLKNLKGKIENLLNKISIDEIISEQNLREVQDMIYYNRKLSILIPDFIYGSLRKKTEDEMHYDIAKTIKELKKRAKKI